MNGHTTLPVKAWKEEAARRAAERAGLYQEYTRLKEEVREEEIIRRHAENLARDERDAAIIKDRGAEL